MKNEMMRLRIRRGALGLLAGAASSFPPAAGGGHTALAVALGAFGGALYLLFNPSVKRPGAVLDGVFTAAALGIVFWGAFSVVALPVMTGQGPQWTAGGDACAFSRVGRLGVVGRIARIARAGGFKRPKGQNALCFVGGGKVAAFPPR